MEFTYQGVTTCIENVNVVSEMDDEIIFGRDWIHKTRVVIQSDGSKIIVSNQHNHKPDIPPKLYLPYRRIID